MSPPRATSRLLAAVIPALVAVGCQGVRPDGTVGETLTDPQAATGPEVIGHPGGIATTGRAIVDLGPYADDARIVGTAARWPDLVDRAVAALPTRTGLAFPPTKPPRVRLAPLGDERQDFAVDAAIEEGRRVARVTVNVEPLAAGRRDAETVLLRGLAAAVYEDVAHRLGPPPAYVARAAEIVAADDQADRLADLVRTADGRTPAVDPEDPRAAEATAAAALVLLEEHGGDGAIRRFLRFAAEGDDPNTLLARAAQDPVGRWAGRGRTVLTSRLRGFDRAPWQLLDRARRTLREEGRGAMESILPASLPSAVAPEITALRAQAFANEGDYESARRLLASLEGDVRHLAAPGETAALRVRAERAPGGDPALAARLEAEWKRDYPRLAAQSAGVRPGGREAPSLASIRARVRALLEAHEAGAAARYLEQLGDRGLAPELADVQRAVVDAQTTPSPQAIEVNRRRVRTWTAEPTPEHAGAVRAGGIAAAVALAEALPRAAGPTRRRAVRLLEEAGGTGRAVELLAPTWRRLPSLLRGDLDALIAAATWPELMVWVQGVAGDVPGSELVWAQLRFGVSEPWVRAHPQVLSDLRSEVYPVRRRAFDEVVAAEVATPALVAHGLRDPAPLMRRAATEAAGQLAFPALLRIAFQDAAWMVRQAACAAIARSGLPEAPRMLLGAWRADPSTPVRLAAGVGLFELSAPGRDVLDALIQGLADPEPAVRELAAARLPGLEPTRVVPAVLTALEAEVRRPELRGPVIARLFLVLQRAARRPIAYVPGMSRREVQRLVAEARTWAVRAPR